MRAPNFLPLTAALLLAGSVLPLRADERTVYYAEPAEPPNFLHRVSDFFRDLFTTENGQSLSPHPTPPQPTAPRYNLDLPPPGAGYGYGYHHHPAVTQAEQKDVSSTEQSMTAAHGSVPKTKAGKRVAHTTTSTEAAEKPEPPKPSKKKPSPQYAESTPEPAPAPTRRETTTTTTTTTRTTSPKVPSDTSSILTGTRTSKSTRVKSPYPPYNELDVTGLPSGSLAQDPTTQKIFRVP